MNGGGHLISIDSKRIEIGNRQIFELKGLPTLKKSKTIKAHFIFKNLENFNLYYLFKAIFKIETKYIINIE